MPCEALGPIVRRLTSHRPLATMAVTTTHRAMSAGSTLVGVFLASPTVETQVTGAHG